MSLIPTQPPTLELDEYISDSMILLSPLAGDLQVGYMLPKARFGLGLYQEETASLGPGCLETLIEALAGQIRSLG